MLCRRGMHWIPHTGDVPAAWRPTCHPGIGLGPGALGSAPASARLPPLIGIALGRPGGVLTIASPSTAPCACACPTGHAVCGIRGARACRRGFPGCQASLCSASCHRPCACSRDAAAMLLVSIDSCIRHPFSARPHLTLIRLVQREPGTRGGHCERCRHAGRAA